ncbi:NFATC2-interacting protein-like, partial [Marmota marmota marmota]|uniref:NFATC2-interacting protein-like n=1 Tax=Marmota marmota marmota TaxID=9994 RepID=UPI0020927113
LRQKKVFEEVNKHLQDLSSSLSPKQHQGQGHQSQDDEVVIVEGPVLPESPWLFPLKIWCRADLIRFAYQNGCVVLASSSEATETSQQLCLRVQRKEKHQMLGISLSQDSPLKTLMLHYEEAMGLSGHKLSFFFDGTKLSGKELPADLGMESGDLIEVWG